MQKKNTKLIWPKIVSLSILTLLFSEALMAAPPFLNANTEKSKIASAQKYQDIFNRYASKAPSKAPSNTTAQNTRTTVPYRPGYPKAAIPPILEHALEKINAANQNQANAGKVNPGSSVCQDCETDNHNIRFNQCNSKNSYLEKQINRLAGSSDVLGAILKKPISSAVYIKPSCIEMGMNLKFGSTSDTFRTCSGNSMQRAIRPCISENYFKLMSNSFDTVSSCMNGYLSPNEGLDTHKQDVLSIYALINVESGFHVNAVSGTGAGGIGQFTATAIESVNKNQISDVRKMLNQHSNPICRQISNEMLSGASPMAASSNRSCGRIDINAGNPVKNMIYTFASLKGVKEEADRVLFQNKNYKSKFAGLPKSEINKIERALIVWAHNAGPSGTWTPTKSLLNSVYRSSTVRSADEFINQVAKYMKSYPASANRSASRRNETSSYFPKIASALKQIEKSSQGQSCLN